MISNQIIQTSIDELKAITKVDLYVYDVTGSLIAGTTDRGTFSNDLVISFAQSPADSQVIGNDHLLKVLDEGEPAYILIARGTTDDVYMVGKMAAFQISSLIVAYKERFDKDNFIKNLLLDNLLLVDIYSRAKKLHIQPEVRRVAIILESMRGKDNNMLEAMRTSFGGNTKDFITAVDENNVIVVKELKDNEYDEEIEKYCESFMEALMQSGVGGARIACGG